MNVPNTLSFFRLLMIPAFCWTFLKGGSDQVYYYYAGLALALSALSDLLDGFFARLLHQETELGKWLDPIADKLTLGAVCVCMWLRFHEHLPILTVLFALLLLKEFIMAIGGLVLFRDREILPARWWGKIGTAGFYACMMAVMLISLFNLGGEHQDAIIVGLVAFSVALMLFAFVRYFIVGLNILKEKKQEKSITATETSTGKE